MSASTGRKRCSGVLAVCLCVLLGSGTGWSQAGDDSLAQGEAALRSGDYERAGQLFEAAMKDGRGPEQSRVGLLRVLYTTGEYREAVERLEEFLAAYPDSAALCLEGGRIYRATGEYAKAESLLKRVLSLAPGRTPGRVEAMRNLAELLLDTGREAEARQWWNAVIEEYQAGYLRDSRSLGAAAVAAWRLGYIDDARDIFLDATESPAGDVSLQALADFGYLFLEKYIVTEAMVSFKDCLEINPAYPDALIGMARSKKYGSDFEVEAYARAALNINPNLVPARNLLAGLALDAEFYEPARNEIETALAVNPLDLESLSLLAVHHFLSGDTAGFESTESKILGIHPRYGRFYYILAENLASRRKYEEAVHFSRKAIDLDPKLWSAYQTLGMNLTRIGDLEGGRRAIEQAFEGDPSNVWAYNSLDLLDQVDTFVESRSEHFIYRMSREDGPVLSSYAARLAEEAYEKLTRRYGFRPQGPIHVEFFPDHGGFAVRTLGLPGLEGALGVCFGKVIAVDSPAARKVGSFNWGSALWHEFAHVITLQMTNHNIPRWFSEGVSVFEEHKARPGWGDHIDLSFVKAYKEGKLLKASELNRGFTRPESPEQVLRSYIQAGLVCEWMEETFGFESIRQALRLFSQNVPEKEVFRQALGLEPEQVDEAFARYEDSLLEKIAASVDIETGDGMDPDMKVLDLKLKKNPEDFFANLHKGALLAEEKSYDEAERHLKKAQELFPQYVEESGNPYQLLARIYLETGREDDAVSQLEKWIGMEGDSREPLLKAAEIYAKRRQWSSLAGALDLSVYIHPYDVDIQRQLGKAALESGMWEQAIDAYRTLIKLNATDPAEAHLDLATALAASGDTEEAKRETLKSLEIAPSFRQAQKLLLELSGDKTE